MKLGVRIEHPSTAPGLSRVASGARALAMRIEQLLMPALRFARTIVWVMKCALAEELEDPTMGC